MSSPPKRQSIWLPLLLMFGVIVIDQLTKFGVMRNFALYEIMEIIPGLFNLTYLTNTGAAFGLFAGEQSILRQVFFAGIAMGALIFMFITFRYYRNQGVLFVLGIGLIAGGAAGNLIDRLRFGSVVDFLDFYVKGHHWPAFNIADSAITVGAGLFLLASIIHPSDRNNQEQEQ